MKLVSALGGHVLRSVSPVCPRGPWHGTARQGSSREARSPPVRSLGLTVETGQRGPSSGRPQKRPSVGQSPPSRLCLRVSSSASVKES